MPGINEPNDYDGNEFVICSDKECIELIQLIINQTSDGILITKIDQSKQNDLKVLYANSSFYQMSGYAKEETVGKHPYQFLSLQEIDKPSEELIAAFESQESLEIKSVVQRKNGEQYWVNLSFTSYQSDKENVAYRIINYRELTYEILLSESQQKYKSLFDNHPNGVFALDINGNFTSTNKACEKITGYSKVELLTMSLTSLIAEKNLEDARKAFNDALQGLTKTVQVAIKNKSKKIVNGTITSIPIYVNDKIEGVYGIAQDTSHTKQLTKILNIEKRVLENTIGGGDLKQTLNLFLSELESLYPSLNLTIMLANAKESHLDFFVGESIPPSFAEALSTIPLKLGSGACGTSAFLKKATLVPDVAQSSLMEDYWDLANTYNIKACWSYPIFSSKGAVLGTLAVYRKQRGFPDKKLERLIERAANIISILIENKQNEAAYKQLNERYKLAMDASSEAIWDWDVRNNTLLWGSGFEIIFGYPIEKIAVSYEWWSVNLHPDDKERVIKSLNEAIASKTISWSNEYRYKAADGEYRYVLDRGNIIRNGHYEAVRMVGAMMDLTDRRLAEETIRESEEQFRSLANSTMEGIAISRNEKIIDYNKAFATMVGYDQNPEKLIGKSVFDFIPEENLEVAKNCIELAHTKFFEVGRLKKRGRSFPVEIRTVASIYKGKPAKIVSFRDISKRKEIEKKLLNYASELSRSNAELEQFAYMASHDLQEPLRMITSFLQLLKAKYGGQLEGSGDQYIAYAVDGAERMKTLIKDLLKFSKISFQEDEKETIDLNKLLHEIKNIFSTKLQEENGVINIHHLPVIEGQKSLLAQLFQNLVGNALKYREKKAPVINISAKELENFWEFIIADNGIGIEEKFHDKIFVVFQRLHTRDEFQGTGIGLAICKKIVEKYGGKIWVISKPREGSEFHFTIRK